MLESIKKKGFCYLKFIHPVMVNENYFKKYLVGHAIQDEGVDWMGPF
jgi:hypothetical protein